jgi:hypothetical protein
MTANEAEAPHITQPRAYQLELFEESMKRNVIVTVRAYTTSGCQGIPNATVDGYG